MTDPIRPASRWTSSTSTRLKSSNPANQSIPLIVSRRKLLRSSKNHQQTFSQHMAKVRHDTEELFQLYYSNNIKFDNFQQQIVTGTRILYPESPTLTQSQFVESSNAFNSKHCTSQENFSTLDTDNNDQEASRNELKQPSAKRTVQVRIDNNPMIVPSTPTASTRSSSPNLGPSTGSNSNLNTVVNSSSTRPDDFQESSLMKKTSSEDIVIDSFERTGSKTLKTNNEHRLSPAKISLSSLSHASLATPSLYNARRDPANLSYSSFSTYNTLSSIQQRSSNSITGTTVRPHHRSPKRYKPRAKSSMTMSTNSLSSQSNGKTSSVQSHYNTSDYPVFIGAQRVVSIPSKCSRYVLVTFPQVPIRYNAPTTVERLLLPERFPTLFHNILHSHEHHPNNK